MILINIGLIYFNKQIYFTKKMWKHFYLSDFVALFEFSNIQICMTTK